MCMRITYNYLYTWVCMSIYYELDSANRPIRLHYASRFHCPRLSTARDRWMVYNNATLTIPLRNFSRLSTETRGSMRSVFPEQSRRSHGPVVRSRVSLNRRCIPWDTHMGKIGPCDTHMGKIGPWDTHMGKIGPWVIERTHNSRMYCGLGSTNQQVTCSSKRWLESSCVFYSYYIDQRNHDTHIQKKLKSFPETVLQTAEPPQQTQIMANSNDGKCKISQSYSTVQCERP